MTAEEKEEFLRMVAERFIPFNEMLAIRYVSAEPLAIAVDTRPELMGHKERQMLHGGVTAALLDAAGGMIIIKNLLDTSDGSSQAEALQKMARVATIDLRVDYIRPGVGEVFTATAEIIRPGKRVTVTRMELRNEQDVLIALGTGTFAV